MGIQTFCKNICQKKTFFSQQVILPASSNKTSYDSGVPAYREDRILSDRITKLHR